MLPRRRYSSEGVCRLLLVELSGRLTDFERQTPKWAKLSRKKEGEMEEGPGSRTSGGSSA